jgi:hypothetical protein
MSATSPASKPPSMDSKRTRGSWLHAAVAAEARELVGIDADTEGVERVRALGYEAYAADVESGEEIADLTLEPADIVVAGELAEHLDRPGSFLEDPDHVAWLSWRTFATLLARHGWTIESLAYYRFPRVEGGTLPPRIVFNGYQAMARPLFRWRPNLADGILVVARLT